MISFYIALAIVLAFFDFVCLFEDMLANHSMSFSKLAAMNEEKRKETVAKILNLHAKGATGFRLYFDFVISSPLWLMFIVFNVIKRHV